MILVSGSIASMLLSDTKKFETCDARSRLNRFIYNPNHPITTNRNTVVRNTCFMSKGCYIIKIFIVVLDCRVVRCIELLAMTRHYNIGEPICINSSGNCASRDLVVLFASSWKL